jgi:hypothetical protein
VKTQRERDDERRHQKLKDTDDKVREGSLVIRPMTAEERERDRAQARRAGQRTLDSPRA